MCYDFKWMNTADVKLHSDVNGVQMREQQSINLPLFYNC